MGMNSTVTSGMKRVALARDAVGLVSAMFWMLLMSLSPTTAGASLSIGADWSAPKLAAKADLVIKGQVVAVEGAISEAKTAELKVDRVLKGDWRDSRMTLSFSMPNNRPIDTVNFLVPGEHALFFLRRSMGLTVPCQPEHFMMPVRAGNPADTTETADVLERLRDELMFTAAGPVTFSREDGFRQQFTEAAVKRLRGKFQPTAAAALPVAFRPISLNASAACQLGNLPVEKRTLQLLNVLLTAEDRQLRGAAITSLLLLKQAGALEPALEYINSSPPGDDVVWEAPGLPDVKVPAEAFDMIVAMGNLEDPTAVNTLGGMMEYKNVFLRRFVAQALRGAYRGLVRDDRPLKKLSDGKSIPFLVGALDDEDLEVRFEAVAGLAEVTGKHEWYPVHGYWQKEFKPQEERDAVARWKQWWVTEGKAAFAGAQE